MRTIPIHGRRPLAGSPDLGRDATAARDGKQKGDGSFANMSMGQRALSKQDPQGREAVPVPVYMKALERQSCMVALVLFGQVSTQTKRKPAICGGPTKKRRPLLNQRRAEERLVCMCTFDIDHFSLHSLSVTWCCLPMSRESGRKDKGEIRIAISSTW